MSFCDVYSQLNNLDLDTSASPADLKAAVDQANKLIPQLKGAAPATVKDDVNTEANLFGKISDIVKAANYDGTKIDESKIDALDTDKAQQAASKLDDYFNENCDAEDSPTS